MNDPIGKGGYFVIGLGIPYIPLKQIILFEVFFDWETKIVLPGSLLLSCHHFDYTRLIKEINFVLVKDGNETIAQIVFN